MSILGTGRAMGEDEQNIDCLSIVMCCSPSGNVDGQKVQFSLQPENYSTVPRGDGANLMDSPVRSPSSRANVSPTTRLFRTRRRRLKRARPRQVIWLHSLVPFQRPGLRLRSYSPGVSVGVL